MLDGYVTLYKHIPLNVKIDRTHQFLGDRMNICLTNQTLTTEIMEIMETVRAATRNGPVGGRRRFRAPPHVAGDAPVAAGRMLLYKSKRSLKARRPHQTWQGGVFLFSTFFGGTTSDCKC